MPSTAGLPQGSRIRFVSQGGTSKIIPRAGDCLWATNACVSESEFSGRGMASITKAGSAWILDAGDPIRKFASIPQDAFNVPVGAVNYAATDGFLMIYAIGAYMNGLEVWVGTDSSVPWLVSVIGDDYNNNSKAWSTTYPLRKGMYYYIKNGSSRIGFGYGFENVVAWILPMN